MRVRKSPMLAGWGGAARRCFNWRVRKVSVEERRSRLAWRHHLARPTRAVDAVAAGLVGLHSSDPVTVFLSCWARVEGFKPGDLEEALYERRSLVRMWGMRRTLFVVPLDLAAVMDAACARALAGAERRRVVRLLQEQEVATDGAAWLADLEPRTLAALAARGEATAVELTRDVPELGLQLRFGEGTRWPATVGMSTRVLFMLATEARIVRARPLGSWRSGQYRWALIDRWLDGGLAVVEPVAARQDLARRYLHAFGPATLVDLTWWAGWAGRPAKVTLTEIGAVEVELEEGIGYLLPDDLDPVPTPEPWAALLPGLDSSVMGWKERRWLLGEHQPVLFDRNGNAGPTVCWNGHLVGAWAQRRDGEIAMRLVEDVGAEAEDRIAVQAARLATWLDEVRITPRFRTVLESELAG